MSWLIKQYKNGKYGIWSTIVDAYITEPRCLTREQAISFIVQDWQDRLDRRVKVLRIDFPKGWFDKDTKRPL